MTTTANARNEATLAGRHILVLDDHEDSVILFKAALELCGATAHAFSDVTEAVAALATTSADAVVSDLELHGGRVEPLLHAAKALRLPVLLLTGHARPEDLARAMALGFDDYRVKPIDPMDLCRAVAKLLERHRETG